MRGGFQDTFHLISFKNPDDLLDGEESLLSLELLFLARDNLEKSSQILIDFIEGRFFLVLIIRISRLVSLSLSPGLDREESI